MTMKCRDEEFCGWEGNPLIEEQRAYTKVSDSNRLFFPKRYHCPSCGGYIGEEYDGQKDWDDGKW